MRATLALALALAAGCRIHPVSPFTPIAAIGGAVARVAATIHVNVDTQAFVAAAAATPAAAPEPVDESAPAADPDPTPESAPPAPRASSVFVAQWGAGCTRHASYDECQADCKQRFDFALKMGGGTSCSCVENARCN